MDRLQILFFAMLGMAMLWLVWQGAKLWLRRSIQVEPAAVERQRPTLLYFSSRDCELCRLQQSPVIASLKETMTLRAHFQEYDAVEHPDLARRYRVLTVPTTLVLSPCGDVVAVNYDVTQEDKLQRQLAEAAGPC